MQNTDGKLGSDPAIEVNGQKLADYQAAQAAMKEMPGEAPEIEMGIKKPNGSSGTNGVHAANGKSAEPVVADLIAPKSGVLYDIAPKFKEVLGKFVGIESEEMFNTQYKIVFDTKSGVLNVVHDGPRKLKKVEDLALGNVPETKVELPSAPVEAINNVSAVSEEGDLETQLEAQRLRNRMSDLNNLALLELEDLAREKAYKDREEKGRDFRKNFPKKIWEGLKSFFSTSKEKSYQRAKQEPQKRREELFADYTNERLMLQSKANLKYEFIKENGREASKDELLTFKGKKADVLLDAHAKGYKYWTDFEESDEHKNNLQEIINSSAYLRFKQNPKKEVSRAWNSAKEWHNNSWLNKPVVASLKEFGKAPATWSNLKAFFAGRDSVYTYPERKVEANYIHAAAHYDDSAESNTNSGVVRKNNSDGNNNGSPRKGGWGWKVAAVGALALAALGGVFLSKKNQSTEENNNAAASMVVDDTTTKGNEKQDNVANKTGESDQLESLATAVPEAKKETTKIDAENKTPVKKVAKKTGGNGPARAKSVSRGSVDSRLGEKPDLQARVKEAKPAPVVEEKLPDVLSMEEMNLAKNSLSARLSNLKARIANPGYKQPALPEGTQPYGATDYTSTSIAGIPQSESYESHIAIVEEVLAKDKFSKEDVEKAEKALTASENRMNNNVLAENIGRYKNAYNLQVAVVRERLKNYRILAKKQFSDGKTKSENQYMIPGTNLYMDINKLEQEVAKLPADFRNEAFAKWSNEYAKWFADHRAPKNY